MAGKAQQDHLVARRDPVALVALPPYRIGAVFGTSPDLVLSFASVGRDPAHPPAPEFVGSATAGGRSALFIADDSRSWTNAPGLAEALERAVGAMRARAPVARILAMGQSMGGFAALVAAGLVPVDAVLAFGPQAGIGPAAPLGETRWAQWTGRLASAKRLTAPLPRGPRLTLFHGLADDAAQALAFPRQTGTDHLLFPGLTHSALVAHLKARGCLAGLIEAALSADRRRLLRIAASAGGRLRQRLAADLAADQEPR